MGEMVGRVLKTCAMVVALGAMALAGPDTAAAEGKPLVLAGGPELGAYYPVAVALKLTAADAGAMLAGQLAVTATPGSMANLNGLRKGRYDLAIVQEDLAQDAFRGTGPFTAEGPSDGLRLVMRFHKEALVLVARRGAKISKLADLKGKRVASGPEGAGWQPSVDRILASLGGPSAVTKVETREDSGVRALCRGDVDAAFFVIGQPSAMMVDVLPRCKARLVPIDGAIAKAISQSMPSFRPVTIPGRLYPSQPNDVKTLGVDAVLLARADADDGAVAALVTAVRENLSLFRNLHPVLSRIDDEALRPDAGGMPLHTGAARAFRQAVAIR